MKASANEIKQALRDAKTADEVESVAAKYRPAVLEMIARGGDDKTLAMQISNLKTYRLGKLDGQY